MLQYSGSSVQAMILSAMDLYDESFKITDMIDSDLRSIRSELDDYFSELPRTPGSPILSSHPSGMSVDASDNTMDSEFSDDGRIGWMNSSHMYNVSSDLDSISGLLVNPETALPVSMTSLSAAAVTIGSSGFSGAVNVTVAPNKTDPAVSSELVKLPMQVITTATAVLSEREDKHSKVNVTVSVPSVKTEELSHENQTFPHVQNVYSLQDMKDSGEIQKPRSRQKQSSKIFVSQSSEENSYPKPAYSYSCLIAMALKNSKTGSLPVNEIYDFMIENFPYFKTAPNGWKNSVRHNLSLNKCFEKIEKPTGNGAQRKGYLWALNPSKVEKMEEEFKKWSSKDPAAIRKSMANPERLELIERGELKKTDDDDINEADISSVIKAKKENVGGKNNKSSRNALVSGEFSPLDEPVGMDSSLPDLDIQKGLWENFGDDRLQFVGGSPMNSSSPKHHQSEGAPNSEINEDSSSSSSPSESESFIHGNYTYSCTGVKGVQSRNHSCLTDKERQMACDA